MAATSTCLPDLRAAATACGSVHGALAAPAPSGPDACSGPPWSRPGAAAQSVAATNPTTTADAAPRARHRELIPAIPTVLVAFTFV
ncbi:hypothetical protein Cco03nite_33000 [Catellatospora coxensis]|uniref:Uncharacterized protein n=1 Tax=Catellatospora coxensis TaxID=310354 RepID=A0A8J3L519_9ACTN|nr:hypothetical protein Cco03nite_33000 [Catellatospora coxensis]